MSDPSKRASGRESKNLDALALSWESGYECDAGVSYKVDAYPVDIGLQGTTIDNPGGATCLIGQGLQANLVAGGASFTNYNWSFGSGIPFKSWTVTNSSATVTYLNAADYNSSNPLWFYAQPGSATVSCSATAIGFDGTNIGTVQAKKIVSVQAPVTQFTAVPNGCSFAPDFSDVHSGPSVKDATTPGIQFTGSNQTPTIFGGVGQQQTVQLIKDDATVTQFVGFDTTTTTSGQYWLDYSYPYPFDEGPIPCIATGNTAIGAGVIRPTDSPYEGIFPQTKSVIINDDFKMYLLYQPPVPVNKNGTLSSAGVQWVPVWTLPWHWDVSTSRPYPIATNAWKPNPPGITSQDVGSQVYGDFPVWTNKFH